MYSPNEVGQCGKYEVIAYDPESVVSFRQLIGCNEADSSETRSASQIAFAIKHLAQRWVGQFLRDRWQAAARDSSVPVTAVVSAARCVRWQGSRAAIEEIAQRAGVPVGALIRGWVLQGLATEQGTSLRDGIERLVADADRLRRLDAASESSDRGNEATSVHL